MACGHELATPGTYPHDANYEPEAIPYTSPLAFDWGSSQIAVAIPFLS
jgi:hypothetical protein